MNFLSDNDVKGLVNTLAGVANCRLTEIHDTPAMDPSGRKTGAGALLWQGSVAGYLDREEATDLIGGPTSRNDVFVAGVETVVDVDTFTILDAAGAPLLERPGSEWEGTTITIEDRRTNPSTTWTWRVRKMRHDAFGTLDSATFELEQPVQQ